MWTRLESSFVGVTDHTVPLICFFERRALARQWYSRHSTSPDLSPKFAHPLCHSMHSSGMEGEAPIADRSLPRGAEILEVLGSSWLLA